MKISLKNTLNLLNDENKIRKKAEDDLFSLNEKLEDTVYERTIALKKQNKELKNMVEKLDSTQDDLNKSEKMANLGELVGGITHEINTPLGISITTASFIQTLAHDLEKIYTEEDMSEEDFQSFLSSVKENIKNILSSLNRVSITLNSFRDIALDQVIEEKRIFNVHGYLDEILISLRHKTKKYKHEMIIDVDKSININSYPGYFYQIFTNLINNSYLHAFEDVEVGKIVISIHKFVKYLELIYSDNGTGIKKEQINEIFKEYYTTKRGTGGTGLGLGIVNNLITNKLKGSIKVESGDEEGLKYIIIIPLDN
ncbi:MAG: HAMP domain-containing histidine kinase [Campylobacteraceae bacterium]|nr:HAMP domain-containing histidine kinase [Campylobacteraceae bacterium]